MEQSEERKGAYNLDDIFPQCGNKYLDPFPSLPTLDSRQSPINIDTSEVKYWYDDHIWWKYSDPTLKGTITERHTTPTFEVVTGEYQLMGVPGYKETHFVLHQFHFHFRDHFRKGSEHSINWKKYDAEVHFVHFNSKYTSFKNALDKPDGLLVIGIFLQVGSPIDFLMDKILQKFHKLRDKFDYEVEISNADILRRDFYIYEGSTTTTSCDQKVVWLVQRHPMGIAQPHMDLLRTLGYRDHTERIAKEGNVRPLQTFYSPKVYANFESTDENM